MISKKRRVTKELFLSIMEKGKILHGSFFVFRYLAQQKPQYAFVAPKSAYKKAVDRNNARRKGYSIIKDIVIKDSAGIFFFKNIKNRKIEKAELKEDVLSLLKKASLF